jgi:hypothetical protein
MALVFLGDPMVDIMIECSTEFLHSQGIAAESIGGSELVSHDALDALRTAACQSAGVANGGYRCAKALHHQGWLLLYVYHSKSKS